MAHGVLERRGLHRVLCAVRHVLLIALDRNPHHRAAMGRHAHFAARQRAHRLLDQLHALAKAVASDRCLDAVSAARLWLEGDDPAPERRGD